MKRLIQILLIALAGAASVLIAQYLVKKLYHRRKKGDRDPLFWEKEPPLWK